MSRGCAQYRNSDGVSCYINSILSIFQNTPILTDYIVDGDFPKDTIIYHLQKLIKCSLMNPHKVLRTTSFRKKITEKNFIWGELEQQDSQEFLTFLISSLEDDIKQKVVFLPEFDNVQFNYTKINKGNFTNNTDMYIGNIIAQVQWEKFVSKEFSPIKMLFTGQLHDQIICENCGYTNNKYDIFQNLQLDITGSTLIECLHNYNLERKLDKDNMIYCDYCHKQNQAITKSGIWKCPKILIINFKRFKMNDYGQVTGKNTNTVKYDKRMSINSEEYNLFAVNLHHGRTIHRGHYTSYVLNRFDDTWYEFDDETATPIQNIVSNNAVLLFYIKKP